MWYYSQTSGQLKHNDELISVGYSGFGEGKNNPALQQVANVGPVPQGLYEISHPYDTPTHGPLVMALVPQPSTNTFGRSEFLIHGDSIEHPGEASHGCIIVNKVVRILIGGSGDHWLTVCE